MLKCMPRHVLSFSPSYICHASPEILSGIANRVTTPRWHNDADLIRSKMSVRPTYRMAAHDPTIVAGDAVFQKPINTQ
jgi:hypothetical protein